MAKQSQSRNSACTVCGKTPPFDGGTRCQRLDCGLVNWANEPVAFVPIHPKTGPLWANTVPSLDCDRPQHYDVMPLYRHVVSERLPSSAKAPYQPMTEEQLDARYDEIVAKYPNGLTFKQFVQIALESADEDGRIYPHPVGTWMDRQSLMMRMFFDGFVCRRARRNEPGPWYITDKGREYVASLSSERDLR